MKKLLLGLCFITLPVFAAEWEPIVENNLGSIYFSPDSISTDALDRRLVWVMLEDKQPKRKHDVIKMLKVIDCDNRQVGTSAFKGYKKGKVVEDFTVPYLMEHMLTPDPDGFDAILVKGLCGE